LCGFGFFWTIKTHLNLKIDVRDRKQFVVFENAISNCGLRCSSRGLLLLNSTHSKQIWEN
jgi:hypothetical protein